jgi:predicted metal-binding membrane protein
MGLSAADLTRRVLRRERALIGVSVAALAAFGWWYLVTRASMGGAADMVAMRTPPLAALVVMWWLMMVAMMLPSAAPAILLYSRVRETRSGEHAIAHTWVFLAGYLIVWLVFSIAAAVAQSLLTGPSMALGSRFAQGAVLIAAGVYQLSPPKSSCVRQCRSPAEFLSRYWRSGSSGAVRLGVRHGLYCLGCCWLLMALLFVGGVMNLLWVVGLTLIVAIEKLVPRGDVIGRAAGVALIGWGLARLLF